MEGGESFVSPIYTGGREQISPPPWRFSSITPETPQDNQIAFCHGRWGGKNPVIESQKSQLTLVEL